MAAASSQSPPAMGALRRFGAGLLRRLAPKPQKRALCYVQNKNGIWVVEDICKMESRYEKMKEQMAGKWGKVAERAGDILLENVIRSAVLTAWGAGVYSVTKPLERFGIVDAGTSSSTQQKEEITAIIKSENKETMEKLEKLKQERAEDRAILNKLSMDVDSLKEDAEVKEPNASPSSTEICPPDTSS